MTITPGFAQALNFSFHYNKGGTNQVIGSGGMSKITWPNKVFDNFNTVSSDKFTPPFAGKYWFEATVGIDASALSSWGQIYKNGSAILAGTRLLADNPYTVVTGILDLLTTDYIEVYQYVGVGVTVLGNVERTHFQGYYLG